jgi:hypothetical protein
VLMTLLVLMTFIRQQGCYSLVLEVRAHELVR